MRDFTLVQELGASVESHWRTFFDPDFERAVVAAMKFHSYRVIERVDTDDAIRQRTHAVPRLDAAAKIARLFGSSFGYVEEGTFDKRARIWQTRTIPDTFPERMTADMVMEVTPVGDAACRRTLRFRIEARVRGLGGMIESAFENNLRAGWRDTAAFLETWLRRPQT